MEFGRKFGAYLEGKWVSHRYPEAYVEEEAPKRLLIAASSHGTDLLEALSKALEGPFAVLYLLVVPRGGSEAGRYQSPWMNRAELREFLGRHREFFDSDGRHDIWMRSDPEEATLVYDRHNLIYAYGPARLFREILELRGLQTADRIEIPAPHEHCYHACNDAMERSLTTAEGWQHSLLRPEDE